LSASSPDLINPRAGKPRSLSELRRLEASELTGADQSAKPLGACLNVLLSPARIFEQLTE
jgi:hypothetical protein